MAKSVEILVIPPVYRLMFCVERYRDSKLRVQHCNLSDRIVYPRYRYV